MIVDGTILSDDCGECLLAFSFAWTKYTLENNAKDDIYANCLYAIRATTSFYLKNKEQLGEMPRLNELIEMEMEDNLDEVINKLIETVESNKGK